MSATLDTRIHAILGRLSPDVQAQMHDEVAAVLAHGPASVEALCQLLDAPDTRDEQRATICWILAQLKEPDAQPSLLRALESDAATVRFEAARALGEFPHNLVVEALVRHLADDSDAHVRAMTAQQLGWIGGARAFQALAKAAQHPNEVEDVRVACVEALVDTNESEAIAVLVSLLRDTRASVRASAALALGQCGDAQVIAPLRELVASDACVVEDLGPVRDVAKEAIAHIERRTIPGILPVESFEEYAARTLEDDLNAHVDYLIECAGELSPTDEMPRHTLDIYPARWGEDPNGHWQIVGVHEDANADAWARANRRMTARVMATWNETLTRTMPTRCPRAVWRELRGIDAWSEGVSYELSVVFGDIPLHEWSDTLPDTPEPLSEEEQRGLVAAHRRVSE